MAARLRSSRLVAALSPARELRRPCPLAGAQLRGGALGSAGAHRRCAASLPAVAAASSSWRWPWSAPPEDGPERRLVRLTAPARLFADPTAEAPVVAELPAGELCEAIGDVGTSAPSEARWLLVRSPAEDNPAVMSEKPLEYTDGWLMGPELEPAEHQLGDKVAACVHVSAHPVLEVLKRLPPWRGSDGLPLWIVNSMSELYTGRVQGVVTRGRYLVQRPAGAVPERIASTPELLIVPRTRAKQTALAGLVGLLLSASFGVAAHAAGWASGAKIDRGHLAWPILVGWLTLATVMVSPLVTLPCYTFTNSQASTCCVVAWANMLLYSDLFGE